MAPARHRSLAGDVATAQSAGTHHGIHRNLRVLWPATARGCPASRCGRRAPRCPCTTPAAARRSRAAVLASLAVRRALLGNGRTLCAGPLDGVGGRPQRAGTTSIPESPGSSFGRGRLPGSPGEVIQGRRRARHPCNPERTRRIARSPWSREARGSTKPKAAEGLRRSSMPP